MKRNLTNRSTTYYVEGSRNASLKNEIDDLRSELETAGQPPGVAPQICASGFYIVGAEERLKKRLLVSLCAEVPTGTVRIKTVLIAVANCDTANHYKNRRIPGDFEITDGRTHLEYRFSEALEYETPYRLIRLVAIDTFSNRTYFPTDEQAFNDAVPAALLFTTPAMFGVPSSPDLALVTLNRLDPVTIDIYDVELERIVYAPLNIDTGAAQTWGEAGNDSVYAVLTLDGEVVDPNPHILSGVELTQIADGVAGRPLSVPANRGFVKIRNEGLTPARIYVWPKNVIYVNGEKKVSTGPAVNINAGNFSQDVTMLSAVSLVITQTDPNTPKSAAVDLLFTQPATPVGLRWARLRRKVQGTADATYRVVTSPNKLTLQSDDLNTAGAKIVRLKESLKFKPTITYTLECTIDARGGAQKIFTQDVGAGANPDVSNDVAAPSGLNTPTIDWTSAGRVRVRGMFATTDIHTQKKKYLVIYDGTNNGSTKYLDIANRTLITGNTNEASARFEFGLKSHLTLIDVKKKIYKTVFGASGNFLAYWYDENDIGVSAKSADSNTLNVANVNEVLSDDRDSVNVVDIGVTLTGYRNECVNGDFVFDDGTTTTVLNYWTRGTLGGTTNIINTTVGNGVYWDQANHALNWRDKTQQLFQNQKKRFTRNDYRSVTLIAKVIGGNTFSSGTLDILVVNSDSTICTVVGSGINLTDLTSSFQPFGVTFQFDNTTDFNAQKYLRLALTSPVPDPGATREIVLDKIMQNRGKQGASYTPRSNAEEGPGSAIANAENLNITSTGTSSQDLYQPSGASQGGWPGVGLGSVLTPGTL